LFRMRSIRRLKVVVIGFVILEAMAFAPLAAEVAHGPKPVPVMQAIPLPHDEVSFQRDGVEIARYVFGKDLNRPFVFPIIGPSGRSLTRMGHPHDPETHSHHNSVWISHRDVNGVNFWEDRGTARIVEKRILGFDDSDQNASVWTENAWTDPLTPAPSPKGERGPTPFPDLMVPSPPWGRGAG